MEGIVSTSRADAVPYLSTEELFREVNERIVRLSQRFEATEAEYLCECPDSLCAERLRLTLAEYEAVRSDPCRFLMARGHERIGSIVLEQNAAYEVVAVPVSRHLTIVH